MPTRARTKPPAATQLPITKPMFDADELNAVASVLESGWVVQGPQVARFEEQFARFVQSKHAVATTSCTTALHLALLAAGIGKGDEVLVPSFTFVATANAVEYTGARPVFVDIDPATLTIDVARCREYLEIVARRTGHWPRCIMPVSLFGLCADMSGIDALADEFGLVVIEDAACGFGSERQGRHAGTEALAGCFSLHPRKAITTGEGGMIVTSDDNMAAALRQFRDHGASKTDLERHLQQGGSLLPNYDYLGYNYRMTDIQGAIGVAQIAKADQILADRRRAATRYVELLADCAWLKTQLTPPGYRHAYQSFVCLFLPEGEQSLMQAVQQENWTRILEWNCRRNRLMASLEAEGISARQGTHAVHTLGYYRRKYGLHETEIPFSYVADRLTITLPLFGDITESDQARVIETVRSLSGL